MTDARCGDAESDGDGDGDGESNMRRKLVYGPASYTPRPHEWLHEFSWHGHPPGSRDNGEICGKKVPNALHFTKLRLMPDQM